MMLLVPRFRGVAAACAVALAFAEGQGCSNSCSDIGCIQAFTVTPEQALTDPGDYEVRFVVDGKSITCDVAVPSTRPAKCTDARAYVYQEEGSGIEFLSMSGALKTLSVTVLRDGARIAEQSFTPKYEQDEINGRGCGTCLSAADTLILGASPSDAGAAPSSDASSPSPVDASTG